MHSNPFNWNTFSQYYQTRLFLCQAGPWDISLMTLGMNICQPQIKFLLIQPILRAGKITSVEDSVVWCLGCKLKKLYLLKPVRKHFQIHLHNIIISSELPPPFPKANWMCCNSEMVVQCAALWHVKKYMPISLCTHFCQTFLQILQWFWDVLSSVCNVNCFRNGLPTREKSVR